MSLQAILRNLSAFANSRAKCRTTKKSLAPCLPRPRMSLPHQKPDFVSVEAVTRHHLANKGIAQ
jgi:hypothetical protein